MTDGTYVVTGGSDGIGKAIAHNLAYKQLKVVIVARNQPKGETALQAIRNETQNKTLSLVIGDLGTISSCKDLAAKLLNHCPDLKVLINNAGIWKTTCEINPDGLEASFMVNHLAPFILSNQLLDLLKKNAPARIVNVNAGLHIKGTVDLEKTPYGKDFNRFGTYANTKLCNVLYTCELARRIAGSGVTVNALHPGVIKTNLGNSTGILGLVIRTAKLFFGSPATGAIAPVWLATAPELAAVSGKFFNQQKEWELTPSAQDQTLSAKLWELSDKLWSGGRK
jgi:NAD(P)-dependent dehydrogenase (short-subunit alcohol dehydrogenase family)